MEHWLHYKNSFQVFQQKINYEQVNLMKRVTYSKIYSQLNHCLPPAVFDSQERPFVFAGFPFLLPFSQSYFLWSQKILNTKKLKLRVVRNDMNTFDKLSIQKSWASTLKISSSGYLLVIYISSS